MTAEDVRNVTFEKTMRGYRPEDVDDFLKQAAASMDSLIAERDAAVAAKDDAEGKLYILAQKVDEYRGQEDTLKIALINAQRMGETVVSEAKQKAETMLREATGQTELIRQQSEQEIINERLTLERLQSEVTRFKATILNLYKQHIESLSALDAPVEHVREYLGDTGPEPEQQQPVAEYEEEMYEEDDGAEMGFEEAGYEEEAPETVYEPTAYAQPVPPPDPANGVNLFEGVELESEQP